jgi:hypothetical protein
VDPASAYGPYPAGKTADLTGKADIPCLHYAFSFVTNPGPGNAVRLWIESRTTLHDDVRGTKVVFYQCASCKSENTFGKVGRYPKPHSTRCANYHSLQWIFFCRAFAVEKPPCRRPALPGQSDLFYADNYDFLFCNKPWAVTSHLDAA